MSTSSPGPDEAFVKNLFGTISNTYDRANDVITMGMARLWRRELVDWSVVHEGDWILDCATGTGDLALEFKKAVGPQGTVVGTDFCEEMLAIAPTKADKQNLSVTFELGDVLDLQYPDNKFDISSIAYGIRNVANTQRALSEMARVTKPGGRVMILETGEIENPLLRKAIRMYFEKVVPKLGGWVSGHPEAYEYLQNSSGRFPSGAEFCELMRSTTQFATVEFKSLMGGASYIYKGIVKE